MKPLIGINPIAWSNDDLQSVGGDISLQTCLREAARAGYAGIELGHKFPRDASLLQPVLDEHGLSLVSGWYSGRLLTRTVEQERDAIRDHLSLLKAMACKVLIYAEVSGCIHGQQGIRLSQRPKLPDQQWSDFGQRLSDIAELCAAHGIELCYHHHMGTVVQSERDIDALMENTSDAVSLLLDTGHALFAGADPAGLAQRYAGRIGHLHCKDIRASVLSDSLNRDSSFLDAVLNGVFTVPGDGCIDFESVIQALMVPGAYTGWVVVEAEQDASVAAPGYYAGLGFKHLNGLLEP